MLGRVYRSPAVAGIVLVALVAGPFAAAVRWLPTPWAVRPLAETDISYVRLEPDARNMSLPELETTLRGKGVVLDIDPAVRARADFATRPCLAAEKDYADELVSGALRAWPDRPSVNWDGNRVRVAARETIARETVVGIYSIRQYTIALPGITRFKTPCPPRLFDGEEEEGPTADELCEQIHALFVDTIDPGSWQAAGGPATISVDHTWLTLTIRQTPANHAAIRRLFDKLMETWMDVDIQRGIESPS